MIELIIKILLFFLIIAITLIIIFLVHVGYTLYISKDPLPKISKRLLAGLYFSFILFLFIFVGIMLILIIYICFKVFTVKEPVEFPREKMRNRSN